MIFAAGLGSRLRPITDSIPKALVEVGGLTLLEHAIQHLLHYSINELVVNVHHFADKVIDKCRELEKKYPISIAISDERNQLLETGGGLKKASVYFTDEPYVIVYNVDILSSLNLQLLVQSHLQTKSLATLSVRSRKTNRYFLFNEQMELCGWKNMQNNEIRISNIRIQRLKPFAYSGIQVVGSELFKLLQNWQGAFSITDVYIHLCSFYKITALLDNESFWFDVGTIEKLEEAEKRIKELIY